MSFYCNFFRNIFHFVKYRVFYLKRSTKCHTWNPSRQSHWLYLILAAVRHCCSWCTVWIRYAPNFVGLWALVADRYNLFHEILSLSVLLSVYPCQDRCCWLLYEWHQTILMQSNIGEWTRVLPVSTPCSHLHNFCATFMSRGLASRTTLTRVSLERFGES